ncbi:MAG: SDR family oxidoreductase, partial [Flavobacteriales bacterium]|nr:SDR family oxidoreductase [Flavobacteriales bacterium]
SNFCEAVEKTSLRHTLYLSGIINEDALSEHLESRKMVENELSKGSFHLTTLRAGIIIGSGSASFEIIRDLVEKLPIMIAPRWLNTRCQPIGVADVITFLKKAVGREETFDQNFDIGSPDVLTYKEMLLGYAEARGLKRSIGIVPVMTPRLSSYWLYFVTSTSYRLATALVDSMKIEVVCRNTDLNGILDVKPITYREALERTLSKIESNEIISSWKDALSSGPGGFNISEFIDVPKYGCFKDRRVAEVDDRQTTLSKIWRIGGTTGWYYGNWMWKLRGYADKVVGGPGLRRGRTHLDKLEAGDAVDFWRVLFADRNEGRLLLFAEMKLPGEAWLEFKMVNDQLLQTATFRPKGLAGRIYWFAVWPFHGLIFNGLIQRLAKS